MESTSYPVVSADRSKSGTTQTQESWHPAESPVGPARKPQSSWEYPACEARKKHAVSALKTLRNAGERKWKRMPKIRAKRRSFAEGSITGLPVVGEQGQNVIHTDQSIAVHIAAQICSVDSEFRQCSEQIRRSGQTIIVQIIWTCRRFD